MVFYCDKKKLTVRSLIIYKAFKFRSKNISIQILTEKQ